MKKKRLLICLVTTALLSISLIIGFIVYYNSQMVVVQFPSPTGEYIVEMRFTTAFSVGYHGYFCLLANNKEYRINNNAPTDCVWVSNNEFTIGSAGNILGMYKYNADAIVAAGNAKEYEVIFEPWSPPDE